MYQNRDTEFHSECGWFSPVAFFFSVALVYLTLWFGSQAFEFPSLFTAEDSKVLIFFMIGIVAVVIGMFAVVIPLAFVVMRLAFAVPMNSRTIGRGLPDLIIWLIISGCIAAMLYYGWAWVPPLTPNGTLVHITHPFAVEYTLKFASLLAGCGLVTSIFFMISGYALYSGAARGNAQ